MSTCAPYTSGAAADASPRAALVLTDLVAQCPGSAPAASLGF